MPYRRAPLLAVFSMILAPAFATAADYKIEPLKEAPPAGLASPIKAVLSETGYRISTDDGKPFLDLWLRKTVPAKSEPGKPQGAILFPFLDEGELLGAIRYQNEGYDYRDQTIEPGLYTVRYGLQPVNGDHLGVSPFRDYGLLLPAEADQTVENLAKKSLESKSAEAAGTNHPAVLLMVQAPEGKKGPETAHDDEKDRWGAIFALPLKPEAGSAVEFPVQLIIEGAAAI